MATSESSQTIKPIDWLYNCCIDIAKRIQYNMPKRFNCDYLHIETNKFVKIIQSDIKESEIKIQNGIGDYLESPESFYKRFGDYDYLIDDILRLWFPMLMEYYRLHDQCYGKPYPFNMYEHIRSVLVDFVYRQFIILKKVELSNPDDI